MITEQLRNGFVIVITEAQVIGN